MRQQPLFLLLAAAAGVAVASLAAMSVLLPGGGGGAAVDRPLPAGHGPAEPARDRDRFTALLAERANAAGDVVLTFSNSGYQALALNWVHYVERAGVRNYVVVCFNSEAEAFFAERGIAAFYNSSAEEALPAGSQVFGRKDYFRMLDYKPRFALEALRRGFSVLVSDIDTIWLRDPHPFLMRTCDFEIEIDQASLDSLQSEPQQQCVTHGGGYLSPSLIFLRPTRGSIDMLAHQIALQRTGDLHDQPLFNQVVKDLRGNMTYRVLDPDLFPSGHHYFLQKRPQRRGVEPYVIHNNWLVVGDLAKIYRQREFGLFHDDDDSYYAAPRRYLTMALPERDCASVKATVRAALRVATIADRTIIMPSFDCSLCSCSTRCALQASRYIEPPCSIVDAVDMGPLLAEFGSRIREHAFFQNPRVPSDHLAPAVAVSASAAPQSERAVSALMNPHAGTPLLTIETGALPLQDSFAWADESAGHRWEERFEAAFVWMKHKI